MADRYYGPNDIMEIMSVSRATANRIMHMFEQRGELFHRGRLLRVSSKAFDRWVKEETDTQQRSC